MAGIDQLVSEMRPAEGVEYTALALNERGRERMEGYVPPLTRWSDRPETFAHLCDIFAQRNTGRSQQAEIDSWQELSTRPSSKARPKRALA